MAAPYRSRAGLSTRPVGYGGNSDEIQLRIDPMHADYEHEVTGLRKQVRRLRDVAQEIDTEAKFQNEFLNQLQMVEKQHTKTQQKHHLGRIEPCHACCPFCTASVFSRLFLVEICTKMMMFECRVLPQLQS